MGVFVNLYFSTSVFPGVMKISSLEYIRRFFPMKKFNFYKFICLVFKSILFKNQFSNRLFKLYWAHYKKNIINNLILNRTRSNNYVSFVKNGKVWFNTSIGQMGIKKKKIRASKPSTYMFYQNFFFLLKKKLNKTYNMCRRLQIFVKGLCTYLHLFKKHFRTFIYLLRTSFKKHRKKVSKWFHGKLKIMRRCRAQRKPYIAQLRHKRKELYLWKDYQRLRLQRLSLRTIYLLSSSPFGQSSFDQINLLKRYI